MKIFPELLGMFGEYQVAVKLSNMGFDVVKLERNSHADFMLMPSRTIIEVKSASMSKNGNSNTYAFSLNNDSSDFTIIWCQDIDTYYIADTFELKIGVNRVYPNAPRWRDRANAWERIG